MARPYITSSFIIICVQLFFYLLIFLLNQVQATSTQTPVSPTVIKLCQDNAALGDHANPLTTAICSSIVFPSARPRATCKQIPPRSSNSPSAEFTDLSLTSILTKGIIRMKADTASYKSGNGGGNGKAIFLVGNTGAGKTTVMQILAGDLNRLHAAYTEGGDLVIIDDDQRIGAPTIKSKTLVPEYVIHPESGVAFWDCPGFDDNRGSEKDIAAMYFVKHALDTTTQAKFLFVVSHSSVKAGNDRLDFDLLVTHATTLLKNVTQLKHSIGLVVTKVGSYSHASGQYLTDAQILSQIRGFLVTYAKTKSEDLESLHGEAERAEVQAKINFVQVILGNDGAGSGQSHLYFVRSPEDCGPLGDMTSILDTRRKITDLYTNTLQYSPVTPRDFRFSLKAETLLEVETKFVPEVIKKIEEMSTELANGLKAHFSDMFYENLNDKLEDSLGLLSRTAGLMNNYLVNWRNVEMKNKPFSQQLEQLYDDLHATMNSSSKLLLKSYEGQLEFFDTMLNRKSEEVDPSWIRPHNEFSTWLAELKEFYEFCRNAERELAEYAKVGRFTKLVNQTEKENRTLFQHMEVIHFLNDSQLIPVSSRIFNLWQNTRLEDKLRLARVVRRMAPQLVWKCTPSTLDKNKYRMVVTGRNVKLTDALRKNYWPEKCTMNTLKEIEFVALDILFLDSNFNGTGKKLQVSMVAPTWNVILLGIESRRDFVLDGGQPKDQPQAKLGARWGGRGSDGATGTQGESAGTFLGIFSQVHNGDKLYITANGGRGGVGQQGGNGFEGRPGADRSRGNFPSAWNPDKRPLYTSSGMLVTLAYNQQQYAYGGGAGLRGGDGGNGGRGGSPGNRGEIRLFSMHRGIENITDAQAPINTSSNIGDIGTPGAGGLGGIGGKRGKTCKCYLKNVFFSGWWWDNCEIEPQYDRGPQGAVGQSGPKGIINSAVTPVQNMWRVVNEYKLMSFQAQAKKEEFFSKLESSVTVPVIALVEELEAVENYNVMSNLSMYE